MMSSNRALTGLAARSEIRSPCGSREGRIKQRHHEQANACGNRTAPSLTHGLHVMRSPISVVRHYSVTRHSLQARMYCTGFAIIYYTPLRSVYFPGDLRSVGRQGNFCCRGHLDLAFGASQTRFMAHSYIRFDFGTDEEKAQQARHKLDGWRQAFRLDKKLQYKLDRPDSAPAESPSKPEPIANTTPPEKSKGKAAERAKGKAASAKSSVPPAEKKAAAPNGKVSLLVRLYFSSHEKLSEQRWLDRIPSEEPFKSASPKVVHDSDPEFESTDKQFESLE